MAGWALSLSEIFGGEQIGAYLRGLSEKVGSAENLDVGFSNKDQYPDGTPVAQVAAMMQYGAPKAGVPPRQFMSVFSKRFSRTWGQMLARSMDKHDGDTRAALEELGPRLVEQMQRTIDDYTSGVPLKSATVKRKGSSKELIDTSLMRDSVTYKVE